MAWPESVRLALLAAVDGGQSIRDAAASQGVPEGTAARWCAARPKQTGTPDAPPIENEAAAPQNEAENESEKRRKEVQSRRPPPETEAPKRSPTPPGEVPASISAADLSPDDRDLLRKAVRAELRFLVNDHDAQKPSAFSRQASAVTLQILMKAVPDILRFEQATAAPGEDKGSAAKRADAVAASLELEEDEALDEELGEEE
jgi:hypothetical protein